jgi:uncharacterized protein (DUF305 family)
MRINYIAACLAAGALTVAIPGGVQAQEPATGAAAAQHPHTAMQVLTDAQFVQMMLEHHQRGLELVRLEKEQGSSPAVKELATRIGESQERDIVELKALSKDEARGTTGQAEHHGAADHHKGMVEQSETMMKELKAKSGEELDRAFLDHMAKHHQMAISMTEDATLQDPEVKKLAEKMLESQRQELAELKKHLGDGSSK